MKNVTRIPTHTINQHEPLYDVKDLEVPREYNKNYEVVGEGME